jgi:predicted nuclease of restriction endonuclease-like (RecB) superfamily
MPKIPQNNELIGYKECLRDLKERIRSAQVRAGLAVNHGLVLLYWQIGHEILKRQEKEGWGTKIIEQLSIDLRHEFSDMTGLSYRNLKYMRAFAQSWPDFTIVQQLAAQIPWFHHCVVLDKVKNQEEREWYVRATIQNGWSRNTLVHQIESNLYNRQGKAQTNFKQTLPAAQSDLAHQILKDPYNFEFLTVQKKAQEKDIERGLTIQIRDFLLELGTGFSFVGSQYHLEVGEEDFYIDLLFYHLKLRCYVVVEIKTGKFKPEYAGKLNFYLSAIDDLLCHKDDKPSIGIILCKGRDNFVAEYSLRDMRKPIGLSGYSLTESLPEDLKDTLPTAEQIENGLDDLN